ncbi:MAG: AAA family ATPase [Verrucomicrobiales bacterium]
MTNGENTLKKSTITAVAYCFLQSISIFISSLSGFSQYDRYRRLNGAGKTTFAKEFLTNEGDCLRFLNTDEIARGLSPLDSSLSQRQAGRLLLDETRRLIGEHVNFALESTLSGKTQAKIIQSARNHHYRISLFYLWLPSAEVSEKRVEQRVRD